ncbi:MAG: dihydropteroate synthase, partial [Bacteroidales bacterium]|nr:dihydropteroate synthase [Bacteroidales bacterium]
MKIHTQNSILNFDVPKIMGILNVTPDSFYDGGVHATLDAMLTHTEKMLCDGADIIDVGAYSSRPGAQHLSVQEELERIIPIVTKIRQHFPSAILSID